MLMKYAIILSALLFITCKPRIPKEYRKMQKRVEKRERRKAREERRLSFEGLDTVYYKWTPVSPIVDTVFIGVPKIVK